MAQEIVIKTESNIFEAELSDSMTGKAIYGALLIWAKGQHWGCCKRVEEKVCKRLEKWRGPLYPLHEGVSLFFFVVLVL